MKQVVLSLVLLFSSAAFADTKLYKCGVMAIVYQFTLEETADGVKMTAKHWDEEVASGLATLETVEGGQVYRLSDQASLAFTPGNVDRFPISGVVSGGMWMPCHLATQ